MVAMCLGVELTDATRILQMKQRRHYAQLLGEVYRNG